MKAEAAFSASFQLWCGKQGYIVLRLNSGKAWEGVLIHHPELGPILIKLRRISMCHTGTSDLLVLMPKGQAVFVETKAGKYKATKEQIAFIRAVRGLGYKAGVIRSIEDFKKIVDPHIKNISCEN